MSAEARSEALTTPPFCVGISVEEKISVEGMKGQAALPASVVRGASSEVTEEEDEGNWPDNSPLWRGRRGN